MTELPVVAVLDALTRTLRASPNAVLTAPPGAGKTTAVPLALLDERWMAGGMLVLLEPRRLAARAAAARMAETLGEDVGDRIGYRVRAEARVGPATRIEVVTEGVLTRRLLRDPELAGVAGVVFDEFHERSLQADLGLALCREVQAALRPELRLLVMSATLDALPVAALLGGAPVIRAEGRSFPVETVHLGRPRDGDLAAGVAAAVGRALDETAGSVLVFLPGEAEIRRAGRALTTAGLGPETEVFPLYGALPPEAQRAALTPAPAGRRRVILSSAVAETSLTLPGVTAVVDSGLARRPRFSPATGMTRLVTEDASRASTDQRRGRAGRTAPGRCYRLWREAEDRARPAFDPPQVTIDDLAPLALDLAAWGARDPASLAWLDPPPEASFAAARRLLGDLGAVDADGAVTPLGRRMAGLPTHPRLARMALAGAGEGRGGLACDLAAVLEERPFVGVGQGRDAGLGPALDLMRDPKAAGRRPPASVNRAALARARAAAAVLRRRLGVGHGIGDGARGEAVGRLVARAYPERVAQAAGRPGRFRLRNGRGAALRDDDPLAAEPFLAVAELDAGAGDARVFRAAPLAAADLEDLFGAAAEVESEVRWHARAEAVVARRRRLLGALVLEEAPLPAPDPAEVAAAVVDGVRRLGLACLPWDGAASDLRARIAFLRRCDGDGSVWPDVDDAALSATLDAWLPPFLGGVDRRSRFGRIDLKAALAALLPWARRAELDRRAPTHLRAPSGRRIVLDYPENGGPVLAVRLQEMFGAVGTPAVDDGRAPVVLHLLSPAGRPVQVTRDLDGFWANGYPSVRRELRGRYPKHFWPEDPRAARPPAKAKPRVG